MRVKFNVVTPEIKVPVAKKTVMAAPTEQDSQQYDGEFGVPNQEMKTVVSEYASIPSIRIEGEVECSLEEMKGIWELKKDFLKESPELLGEFTKHMMALAEELKPKKEEKPVTTDLQPE